MSEALTISLSALASQINEQHDQATRHAITALEHARRVGVLLQEAKQQVGHGDWLTWLASNCNVSPRQAQRYLKVANNWQAITKNDAASYLTIDDAIALTQQSDKPLVLASEDTDLTMAADTREIAVFEPAEPAEDRKPHVSHNSGDNEWYSPADYVAAGRDVLGAIDLDPASSQEANAVVGATKIYTADDDGLQQPWRGRLWINPPYAKDLCARFVEKLVDDYSLGDVSEAVVLVNNATETQWFQMATRASSAVCFPDKRVRFWKPDGTKGQPLQGQAVFYFGSDTSKFGKAFAKFGEVLGRIGGGE